jgi:two-component system sensor histidine kinase VicK
MEYSKEELFKKVVQYEKDKAELEFRVEELNDFIENASMPLHWVDGNGIILWANKAELDSLGFTKEEYIGFPISQFHADQHVIQDILTRLTNNETLHNYPARLKCKDGSIRHVLINSNVLWKDGEFIHTRCFTRDITDLKNAEEKGAKLAAIIESTDDAIISKTLEGIITSWNDSAVRTFGYTADEMIGQSILELIPEDRKEEERQILSRLRNGERVEHFETKRVTKYGRLLDVSLTISPVRDAQGNIIGLSKIARDITEKKQEEQRKEDFVSMVSHELKTPLTSITAYVQLLMVKAKKEGDNFSINALTRTEIQTKKMISMIQDFLSLARMEEGKMHMNETVFELSSLIEEIAGDIQFLSSSHTLELINCGEIILSGDRDKIGLVLINLISNAIKYSPAGGRITIGCEKYDKKVKIYVTDEGVGISAADQKRLFERFYRVRDQEVKNIAGFGIGLYLVSEILIYHNSKIEVESTEGVGSTFHFTLDTQ